MATTTTTNTGTTNAAQFGFLPGNYQIAGLARPQNPVCAALWTQIGYMQQEIGVLKAEYNRLNVASVSAGRSTAQTAPASNSTAGRPAGHKVSAATRRKLSLAQKRRQQAIAAQAQSAMG